MRRLKDEMDRSGSAGVLIARSANRSPTARRGAFVGSGNTGRTRWDSELPLAPMPLVTSLDDDRLRALLRTTKSLEDDVSLRRQIVWARLKALDEEINRRSDG